VTLGRQATLIELRKSFCIGSEWAQLVLAMIEAKTKAIQNHYLSKRTTKNMAKELFTLSELS
jgi:hypothetical protein